MPGNRIKIITSGDYRSFEKKSPNRELHRLKKSTLLEQKKKKKEKKPGCSVEARYKVRYNASTTVRVSTSDKFSFGSQRSIDSPFDIDRSSNRCATTTVLNVRPHPRGSIDRLNRESVNVTRVIREPLHPLSKFSFPPRHPSSVIWPQHFFFPYHFLLILKKDRAACKSHDPAACPELIRGDRCLGKFTVKGYEKSPSRTCLRLRGWRVPRASSWLENGARSRSQVDPFYRHENHGRTRHPLRRQWRTDSAVEIQTGNPVERLERHVKVFMWFPFLFVAFIISIRWSWQKVYWSQSVVVVLFEHRWFVRFCKVSNLCKFYFW